MIKKVSDNVFISEAYHGEKIHWKINWFFYSLLLVLSFMTYRFQYHHFAGFIGMCLASINLLYNGLLGYFIKKHWRIKFLGYVTITLNILSVMTWSFLDACSNNPAITATSAAVLIYPIFIFLSSLRMEKPLIIYSTILSCVAMNILYLYFYIHKDSNAGFFYAEISADLLSQVYRSVYLLIIGFLINTVPNSLRRLLIKQEALIHEKEFNKKKAEIDPLTSLYNRYFLNDYFERCKELHKKNGYTYALLYIDINGFKKINDTYGHDCGDFVLKSVGKELIHIVGNNDIVARIGGDEIVVIITLSSEDMDIKEIAERISSSIMKQKIFKNIPITVSASIGVSFYPEQGDSLQKLLSKADFAMYSIKRQKIHGVAYAN